MFYKSPPEIIELYKSLDFETRKEGEVYESYKIYEMKNPTI